MGSLPHHQSSRAHIPFLPLLLKLENKLNSFEIRNDSRSSSSIAAAAAVVVTSVRRQIGEFACGCRRRRRRRRLRMDGGEERRFRKSTEDRERRQTDGRTDRQQHLHTSAEPEPAGVAESVTGSGRQAVTVELRKHVATHNQLDRREAEVGV